MSRNVIVCDVESTGLDMNTSMAVEVSYWNLDTDECGTFIPPHSIVDAHPDALAINRYHERIAGKPVDRDYALAEVLHRQLRGQILAGSNPSFDAHMLRRLFTDGGFTSVAPWHHRMLDLSPYAAGVLELDPRELLGLAKVCDALGVPAIPDHSAQGDVTATGLCFKVLFERTGYGS